MSRDDEPSPVSVLEFWFSAKAEAKWFVQADEFDGQIRDRFAETHLKAVNGELDAWADSEEGCLALIIVLDQFSRNIHRQDADAFAQDEKALTFGKSALRRGYDLWLKTYRPPSWRVFMYLPFMHSEHIEDQRRCIDLFLTHGPEDNVRYARAHHDIVARFGRFPHRNAMLGRETTEDEAWFLNQEGSRFG